MKSLAVVGAGWAGLAAAVHGCAAGHAVTLFETARVAGGRARTVAHDGLALDNGQHILIGAYRETLALMRRVGADPDRLLERRPLALVDPHGAGLRLPPGAAVPAFVRGVLALRAWPLGERLALLRAALRWRLAGFRAAPHETVADLARGLPARVRDTLIEPLCVAALNTPADRASAQVFLRVLRDALFGAPGSADLLLPRAPLGALLAEPALRWLGEHGATLRPGQRVQALEALGAADGGWRLDGERFDAVILACTALEAARLCSAIAPQWAGVAAAFDYEPIVTVVLRSRGSRLAQPMTALACDATRPAQFAFDLGTLALDDARAGLFAFVVSGARAWTERGIEAAEQAVLAQANDAFPSGTWREAPAVIHTIAERRATFACVPGLVRPPSPVAPALAAAGDYVAGPYPATLEGAVRSGIQALDALGLAHA